MPFFPHNFHNTIYGVADLVIELYLMALDLGVWRFAIWKLQATSFTIRTNSPLLWQLFYILKKLL